MALKVNRPETFANQEVRLSKAGKRALWIGAVVILILAVIWIFFGVQKKNREKAEQPLNNAVEKAVAVCREAVSVLEMAQGQVLDYASQIEDEKDLRKKADLAVEMIGSLLPYTENNQELHDELLGARNRIYVAKGKL